MGPSKRKGSVRRQVLDLNTKDSSPLRPTWQNKYQHVLPGDGVHQNGDTQSSSSSSVETKQNPLSGLLGNYNSDSDSEDVAQPKNSNLDEKVEDFLKEIQSISSEPPTQSQPAAAQKSEDEQAETYYPSAIPWQQCYDHNSGYPYYWNTETNEVTWEMPAELKAAIAEVALQQQQQQQQQVKDQQTLKQPQKSEPVKETKKKVCKYPWQTDSDSEDEKIEMITSFGPQSDEESEEEKVKKKKPTKKAVNSVGPQLPKGALPGFKGSISLAPDDTEGLNESSYETSSLLTHGVQDTGPPGDESFNTVKESIKAPVTSSKESVVISQTRSDIPKTQVSDDKIKSCVGNDLPPENVKTKVEKSSESAVEAVVEKKDLDEPISIADEVIAQIEKETPPDYSDDLKSEKGTEALVSDNPRVNLDATNSQQTSVTNSQTSGIALLANYEDDSETEEMSDVEKRKTISESSASSSKPLFPIEVPPEKAKPLFPCVGVEAPKAPLEFRLKESMHEEPETVNNIYNSEMEVENPAAVKAFKRKKRIEFATTIYGPSTSKIPEAKAVSPERPVVGPSTQYNMDPSSNEHRGFGFSSLNASATDSDRKTYKNYGGIQFIKAETINLNTETETKEKMETGTENTGSMEVGGAKESVQKEEIEDSATLLREKVAFLTGGTGAVPPIQQMAIELETLVLAWQQGALTPTYLLRWLNEKCGELIRHEKTAAPPGWTCLWDRKNKRYYYRNKVTKEIRWEYPNVEEKVKEVTTEEGGEEMDICDTPPQASSPVESGKQTEEPPSTPPPPVISEVSENCASPTPQAPPPPHISFRSEGESSNGKIVKKKKRKAKEMEEDREGHIDVTPVANPASVIAYDQSSENTEPVPPLPPVPPPPPPPPDESPPPLPDSPPPMSLDPDQPLPPGVDEPEYSLYRRVSPKHSYKKTQSDSSAYPAELMMTYGYGLPVQQVVPTNGQAMALQMQPMEYHSYMHDPVTNHYLVQSAAPTTSQVIQCPAKKSKPSLTSELVSFYSDLAMLDSATENSSSSSFPKPVVISAEPVTNSSSPERTAPKIDSPKHRSRRKSESSPVSTPPTSTSPVHVPTMVPPPTTTTTSSVVVTSTAVKDDVTSNGVTTTKKKEKKKVKPTTGLAMKKKGVSSLVAKWQQVQQEVRRDYSDDDDEGL